MKKFVIYLLCVVCLLSLLLTSCQHTHELAQIEYLAPTTTTQGNIAHYKCQSCGALFQDSDGAKPLTDKEVVLPILEQEIDIMPYIDSLIAATTDSVPAWNQEGYKGRWNYIDGVFLNSIVNLYYQLSSSNSDKANQYKNFLTRYVNYYLDSSGNFVNLRDSSKSGYTSGELDTVCQSKVLFDMYQLTQDVRYVNAINYTKQQLDAQPTVSGSNGNYWHKTSYANQIWLDGMYMYGPFLSRYAVSKQDSTLLTKLVEQYKYIRQTMFNEQKQLYYHAYDSTKTIFWADEQTGCSPSFWLRSMGWYIVSLTDVIEYYPQGEERNYLVALLKEALDGVLLYLDTESNMFYQVVDGVVDGKPISQKVSANYLEKLKNKAYMQNGKYVDATITNYLESSGSSMIAYSLMKAAANNYIDSSYMAIGRNIFEGIYNHSFDSSTNTLNDICITAGLGPDNKPYRDGTVSYYLAEPVGANDAKGVGPFIMAYLQYKFGSSVVQIPTPSL